MRFAHRYIRNMTALSEDECRALSGKHVVVCGCGGLGGYTIEALARIGVGHLKVIDADVFEETNLNRQLLATEDLLGVPKVAAAAQRVASINSEVSVEACQVYLDENNAADLVRGADCVVDCLDNAMSRFWLAHACGQVGIPVVFGAIAGWYGQVCTVFPGDVSFVTIYGAMDSGGEGIQKQEGNLVFTAGITAMWQAAETVKVLLGREGILRNRLLMIDLLDGSTEDIELR